MELRYNLTKQDFKRGLRLHEKRFKGPLTVVRKLEWLLFLAGAVFGGVVLFMLLFVRLMGDWEEDFGLVLALALTTLGISLAFLWVLSARRRAFHGTRLLDMEGGYFGPHTLTLTKEGMALTYGVSRRVEPYDAVTEVWEKKGYVLLYLKKEVWEVLPPCAFAGAEEKGAFLTALAEARQGRPPQTGEVPTLEPESEAAFTLRYAWTPEGLEAALLRANLAYCRTRLFWRPSVVLAAVLSIPMLAWGVLALVGAFTGGAPVRASEVIRAAGLLLIGLGLGSIWLNFIPGFMVRAIRRQKKRDGELRRLLDGPITDVIGPFGVDSLRPGERERTLWSQVGGVKSDDWGLALFRRDRKLLIFPAAAFADRAEQERAADYARTQLAGSPGAGKGPEV